MMEGRCATIRGGVVDIAFEITVDGLELGYNVCVICT